MEGLECRVSTAVAAHLLPSVIPEAAGAGGDVIVGGVVLLRELAAGQLLIHERLRLLRPEGPRRSAASVRTAAPLSLTILFRLPRRKRADGFFRCSMVQHHQSTVQRAQP